MDTVFLMHEDTNLQGATLWEYNIITINLWNLEIMIKENEQETMDFYGITEEDLEIWNELQYSQV
jgi:hypothetical protein